MVTAVATTATPMAFVGAYLVLGIGHVMAGSATVTALQTQLHEAYRGRVMGVHLMGLQSGLPIGAGFGGMLGDQIGLRPDLVLYVGGIVVFIVIDADPVRPPRPVRRRHGTRSPGPVGRLIPVRSVTR